MKIYLSFVEKSIVEFDPDRADLPFFLAFLYYLRANIKNDEHLYYIEKNIRQLEEHLNGSTQ